MPAWMYQGNEGAEKERCILGASTIDAALLERSDHLPVLFQLVPSSHCNIFGQVQTVVKFFC